MNDRTRLHKALDLIMLVRRNHPEVARFTTRIEADIVKCLRALTNKEGKVDE